MAFLLRMKCFALELGLMTVETFYVVILPLLLFLDVPVIIRGHRYAFKAGCCKLWQRDFRIAD